MLRRTRFQLTILLLVSLVTSTIVAQPVTPDSSTWKAADSITRTPVSASLTNGSHTVLPPPQEDPTPTPTPTPTPDPDIEKANKETTLANARTAAAQAMTAASNAEAAAIAARLAAARAKLGLSATEASPSATAPSGNTTTGAASPDFIETQVLAERGGRIATAGLVQQMCGLNKAPSVPALTRTPMTSLVIHNAGERSGISQYRTSVAQLQLLHLHYEKLKKQSEDERDDSNATAALLPLLIPAGTQLIKNVADLMNLFRTETTINSQTITIESRWIVTNLANQLLATNNNQCKVTAIYHPAVYPLTVPKGAKSAIFDVYKQLMDDVLAGDKEVNENNKKVAQINKEKGEEQATITKLQGQIAEQKQKDEEKKKKGGKSSKKEKARQTQDPPFDIAKAEEAIRKSQEWITHLDQRIERLQAAAASLNAFKASLSKMFEILTAVDDATKQPIFNSLVSAERLSDLLADSGTYVLTLNVKASGTNRSRRNLFFNTKLDHSGGASIDANLFNNLDQLVFGKVESFYIEFTGSKKIRERSGFKRLDELQ